MVEKFGGSATKGSKFVDFDGFCEIYQKVKSSDELGVFEDFFEVLKVYDKHQNGKILMGELEHVLLSKGKGALRVLSYTLYHKYLYA